MTWITTAGNGSVMAAGGRGDDVYSQNGSAAMYGIGRILKTGGAPAYENAAATTSSYMISLGAEASVRKLAPMAFPRAFHNSVVLPNGQVLVIGGQGYAVPFTDDWSVLEPELWDPASRRFTRMPPMSVPRNYHGVALLMADGRVVVSGSGLCGEGCATNHPNLQILTPPYLLDGHGSPAVRPIIITAPTQAALGSDDRGEHRRRDRHLRADAAVVDHAYRQQRPAPNSPHAPVEQPDDAQRHDSLQSRDRAAR